MGLSEAIFAAGCFWGVQAAFDVVPGVASTEVGYIGGNMSNPSYEMVCSGSTNHAEAVKVTFDDKIITYDQLLDIFFASHDPTTLNRQGPDIGTQYRSAIFYTNERQKVMAENKIKELEAAGVFASPIVTEVVKAGVFYPAEEYHQKYFAKQGQQKLCGYQPPSFALSTEEWKKRLSPEQYKVLREKATEAPFSGKYLHLAEDGTFTCGACGNPIFKSQDKFDSGSGWPSFDKAIPGSIKMLPDASHGMNRTEVVCSRCGSHLGHLFADGPTDTGMRFCINSMSMGFKSDSQK